MNKPEATAILAAQLDKYRHQSRAELKRLLNDQDVEREEGESGTTYYLDFFAIWDNKPDGRLRVFGQIDDGGMFPLTQHFVVDP